MQTLEEAKADRDARTHVYFVEGAGLVKIGFAARATHRFFSMLTGCPIPLSLLASMRGGPTVENQLHRRFAADRAHGEWFRRSPELDAVIAAAPHQYGPEYQNRLVAPRTGRRTRDRFGFPITHDRYGNALPATPPQEPAA